MPHHTTQANGYTLSDDPAMFDLLRAHRWIATESYWGAGIPLELFGRACAGSLTLGVYGPDGTMAGMARMVTDRATFGWLCDVYVDQGHRGEGLGKLIVGYMKGHPALQGFRRMHLATRDAHGLYAQFGFAPLTKVENWMEIRGPGYL